MRTLNFSRSVTVTLNSLGNGSVSAGPTLPGEIWYPQSVAISSGGTSAGNYNTTTGPSCDIYAGFGVAATTFVDGTFNVQGDSSSMISGQVLYPGHSVSVVWTGANPNVTATMVIQGTRSVP
jgi:hypothetical protein